MSKKWLTVEDIAEELGVSIETVRGWLRSKKLVGYRVGRDWRIKQEDFLKFLEERRNRDDNE